MAKLWKKDYDVDSLIEEFTVGQDYLLDLDLVPYDCLGSMAQAKVLAKIGILSAKEEKAIHAVLAAVIKEHAEGRFEIQKSDEDCHTAIENRLARDLGETGKKIHTGRSRNDQVLTALRLYGKNALLGILEAGAELAAELLGAADAYSDVPMPGRTHMQTGMPSSVGLWAAAFAEELLDDFDVLSAVYRLADRCPLGAAASYGTPLPLDREYSAELLGFGRVHHNVLAANNSRGKTEAEILDALDEIGLTLSKLAQDLILFSLPEFGYFSLPRELCTGSSIMPQKKNPDGLELTRAKAAAIGGWSFQVKSIIRALPSGYNRDFQETKEPFMRGTKTARSILEVMKLTVKKLEVHEDRLLAAFTPDIFAADAAYDRVLEGESFREAYREVGLNLSRIENRDPRDSIRTRTSTGTAGNLGLDTQRSRLRAFAASIENARSETETSWTKLAGFPVFAD